MGCGCSKKKQNFKDSVQKAISSLTTTPDEKLTPQQIKEKAIILRQENRLRRIQYRNNRTARIKARNERKALIDSIEARHNSSLNS